MQLDLYKEKKLLFIPTSLFSNKIQLNNKPCSLTSYNKHMNSVDKKNQKILTTNFLKKIKNGGKFIFFN